MNRQNELLDDDLLDAEQEEVETGQDAEQTQFEAITCEELDAIVLGWIVAG